MKISLSDKNLPSDFEFADVTFNGNSIKSNKFGDIYFSDAGGLDESKHVFLKGNHIQERLENSQNPEFVIGETGFGTGRNLMLLLKMYNHLKEQSLSLPEVHYISVEKYPLKPKDIAFAHSFFTSLQKESAMLRSVYDIKNVGLNNFQIEKGGYLHLIIGDALDMYSELEVSPKVDAWFLDGFSPSKNADMWSASITKAIRKLSRVGTTLATYTVSGNVRKNLTDAGFKVEKVPGFGRKREMTEAIVV